MKPHKNGFFNCTNSKCPGMKNAISIIRDVIFLPFKEREIGTAASGGEKLFYAGQIMPFP